MLNQSSLYFRFNLSLNYEKAKSIINVLQFWHKAFILTEFQFIKQTLGKNHLMKNASVKHIEIDTHIQTVREDRLRALKHRPSYLKNHKNTNM